MDRPGDIEEIQLVAILRTLKKSQDEVAGLLKIRKERVGQIENWLKTEPFDSIEGLFVDYRLKKVIEEQLAEYTDLVPHDLAKAAHVTTDNILQKYRKDYSPKLLMGEVPRNPSPFADKLYKEHQSDMIHLVERLSAELESPLSSLRLRRLKGRGTNISNSLGWQVEDGGSVCLYYGLELDKDAETKILRGYLDQHLHSSSCRWLIEDEEKGIKKWKQLGGEELKMRTHLMLAIGKEIKKLSNTSLCDMNYNGPLIWFSDSVWLAALDEFYGTLGYKVEPFDGGLFKAQYSGSIIGMTATKEEGDKYVEWHKNLMAKYKKDRTAKAINQLKTERELVIKDIQEVLVRFVAEKYIPGKCNYAFCRGQSC